MRGGWPVVVELKFHSRVKRVCLAINVTLASASSLTLLRKPEKYSLLCLKSDRGAELEDMRRLPKRLSIDRYSCLCSRFTPEQADIFCQAVLSLTLEI